MLKNLCAKKLIFKHSTLGISEIHTFLMSPKYGQVLIFLNKCHTGET